MTVLFGILLTAVQPTIRGHIAWVEQQVPGYVALGLMLAAALVTYALARWGGSLADWPPARRVAAERGWLGIGVVRMELFAGTSYRHNSVPGTPAGTIEVAGIDGLAGRGGRVSGGRAISAVVRGVEIGFALSQLRKWQSPSPAVAN